jgi:putative transposase
MVRMPRTSRPNAPGSWHHVMNRGADRQDVFFADDDFHKFEWLLGDAMAAHCVEVHAYCLMTNHFHLLLHCPIAGLSEVMQSIQFRYAQWFNHRYDRDGPVFRGRFRSVLIQSNEQLAAAGRYVHRNPLDLLRREALAAYRWSSLGPYLGVRRPPDWLRTDELLAPFGGDLDRFRRFVEGDDPAQIGRLSGPTCVDVEAAVAELFGILPAELRHSRPGAANDARSLAITMCVELRTATTGELAQRFGLSSQSSVRTIARRGRVRVAADPEFAARRRAAMARVGWYVQPETLGA